MRLARLLGGTIIDGVEAKKPYKCELEMNQGVGALAPAKK